MAVKLSDEHIEQMVRLVTVAESMAAKAKGSMTVAEAFRFMMIASREMAKVGTAPAVADLATGFTDKSH